MSYRKQIPSFTTIRTHSIEEVKDDNGNIQNELTAPIHYTGETIEQKVRRIVNQNEPIVDGAEIIYTERKDGVQPGYNIRTDRFEVAVEAMDKVTKTHLAKREAKAKVVQMEPKKEDAVGEPLQGSNGDPR